MLYFRFSFVVLLVLPLVACDGCKTYKDALIGDALPPLPRLTSWETHLRAFSMAAAKAPSQPLRYKVGATCPLQYGFMWVRRSNEAVIQRKKQPSKMAQVKLFGRIAAKAGKGGLWHLQPLQWKVKQAGPSAAVAPPKQPGQGAWLLRTDGRRWSLAQGQPQPLQWLWRGAQGRFSLAAFWPELPKGVGGHARDVTKKLPDGWLKARSVTQHWLSVEGEVVGVMVEQMQLQRRAIQLDHFAKYVMSTRGHLIYAHVRHRSWVLDPGRGDSHRTETSTEGELRLIRSCHKLVLAPFVTSAR